MKPMFALHKDACGNVLTAGAFSAEYERGSWLRALEIRSGDRIEFHECAERDKPDEPPAEDAPPRTPELGDAESI